MAGRQRASFQNANASGRKSKRRRARRQHDSRQEPYESPDPRGAKDSERLDSTEG
jgi:hypothetical protein